MGEGQFWNFGTLPINSPIFILEVCGTLQLALNKTYMIFELAAFYFVSDFKIFVGIIISQTIKF